MKMFSCQTPEPKMNIFYSLSEVFGDFGRLRRMTNDADFAVGTEQG